MDRAYAEKYGRFEQMHWWFRARRLILRRLLEKEVEWRPGIEVLEIGVGPGLNLYSLYPKGCRLQGMEPDLENAKLAAGRGPVPVSVGTVEEMPVNLRNQTFDVITMFDVLEHIENDSAALALLRQRLRPNGYLVLSVPAYRWLWSDHDVVNQHFRRYTRGELVARLREAGFRLQRATYFNSVLLPPIAVARFIGKLFRKKNAEPKSDFEGGAGSLDAILYKLFASEANWLVRHSFPFGVSVFTVARVPSSSV
jgi:2-polyprenyl-3-methyl-5-hydroxy-6-metoxy-1,4-benzoquinol methylase